MAAEIEQIDFISKFENLVEGLYVMSETDAPLKPFIWKKTNSIDEVLVRKKAKQNVDVPIEILTIDDFFKNMITPQDWHSEEEKADVLKLQNVVLNVKATITEPMVYKVGEIKKDVFIVGKIGEGQYGGLKTLVVET